MINNHECLTYAVSLVCCRQEQVYYMILKPDTIVQQFVPVNQYYNDPNLVENIYVALMWIVIIRSAHNFAHDIAAQLLYVKNCNMVAALI